MISAHDQSILRDLAQRVAEVASLPIMAERRTLWQRHNRLEVLRPLVLVFPEGSWRELLPTSEMTCDDERARSIEWTLRSRLYHHAHLHDDTVIERRWIVNKRVKVSDWGLQVRHVPSADATGAWGFDPVIHDGRDLRKLTFPTVTYDAEGSAQDLAEAQELFGDILDVVQKGVAHVSFHLMSLYCQLRGLEQVMWDMYDNPQMLHDAMSLLEEGNRRVMQQYLDLNLFSLNNDETYHSSGGVGYTTELPAPDYDPQRIRPCDLWASAEAQEMAQVSPEMHATFILPYERRLLQPFGLTGYGCCEDLTYKLPDVFSLPHLRRISISPFADVERCAAQLEDRYIYSWKPHPAHLVGDFDPARVRAYLQHALDVTRGCVVEMILKDTHTCEHRPERFTAWTDIARELVEG